jgi:GNAT superfamily N-acetyltransferase
MEQLALRDAVFEDVPTILDLIIKGAPGDEKREENAPEAQYRAAFDAITADPNQRLMVAEYKTAGVIATMQLTYLPGLARGGAWTLMLESVHVSETMRGHGIGGMMIDRAIQEGRARGCERLQLTSNKQRPDAHRFYERLGFSRSHEGFKLIL